jgi:hypothetical protein
MNTEDLFYLEFSGDGGIEVAFSEAFLSFSREEQVQALEAFFSKKMSEPFSAEDIGKAAAKEEITIILAESLLAKLKRGERIERDTNIDISLEELTDPDGVWD